MAKRSSIRASDADRDHAAERLRQACAEGRIFAHELEERLARALRARTYGELDEVVDDLPPVAAPAAVVRRRPASLELLRRYPLPFAVVVGLLGGLIAALVVAAIAIAASGIWIVPVVFFFVFRARMMSGRRPRRAHRFDDRRVRMHARRYGRF